MTIANGLAMTPTNLKPSPMGEVLQLQRMHSKFMAHQLMSCRELTEYTINLMVHL